MNVGANMLTRIHLAVYGEYPDIEGYDVCPDREGSAGNVLVHATCWEKVMALPAQCSKPEMEMGKKGHGRKDSGLGLVSADEEAYDGDVKDEGVFDLV